VETSEHLCSEAPTEPTGETSPESIRTLKECGLGLWGSQSDARYCYGHAFSPNLRRSVWMSFFLSLPRTLTAALFRSLCSHKRSWQNHIPSSRSFSCNRLSGNKKSRHTNAYRLPAKRIDLSLAVVDSHSCNRLWNSKSKLSFTLIWLPTVQGNSKAAILSLSVPQALSGWKPSFQKPCDL